MAATTSADVSCGLSDSVVAVKLGARRIGCLCFELPFTAAPPAARVAAVGLSPARHHAMLDLLRVFAAHLAIVGSQILLEEQSTESPVITRVKDFLAQHLVDEIKLVDVARVAHMSPCYFCKVFRRATGLAFTEYLSRLRVERARVRLFDRHVRVSEIACEIDFQWLSQFNRVFRRVTGQCPTEYRRTPSAGMSPASQSTNPVAHPSGTAASVRSSTTSLPRAHGSLRLERAQEREMRWWLVRRRARSGPTAPPRPPAGVA